MPNMMLTVFVTLLIVLFSIFVGFVWGEKVQDEREHFLSLTAGKVAFLIGAGILVVGIVIESFSYNAPDPWLLAALGGMVLAKIGSLIYSKTKR